MKICPACGQTYTDEQLNFCLNDGSLLKESGDDAPPTVMMNQARTTQPNWENVGQPISPWQSQPFQQNQPFMPAIMQGQNSSLPTIALVLGICGLVFGCCYGGIPFGIGAVITGYIGLKNVNENSQLYGGRGLAIGGIVLGAIGLLLSIGIILIAIIGNIH